MRFGIRFSGLCSSSSSVDFFAEERCCSPSSSSSGTSGCVISKSRSDEVANDVVDAIEAEVDTDAIDGEIRGEIADDVDAEAADVADAEAANFDFDPGGL